MAFQSKRGQRQLHYVYAQPKTHFEWVKFSILLACTILALIIMLDSARQTAAVLSDVSDKASREIELPPRPVKIELPGTEPILALKDDYNNPASLWMVVSKSRSIPTDYKPGSLVLPKVLTRTDKTTEEQMVRETIAEPLKTMFDDAAKAGFQLMMASGYRSATLQQSYFDGYVRSSGLTAAQQYSAIPGQSEHQTGLAIDISTYGRECYLEACFLGTAAGQWLFANAHNYGFTLRYPEGKESITGYNFEPWHYRYVGNDLAKALKQSGLTLDEAWPYLEAALIKLNQ